MRKVFDWSTDIDRQVQTISPFGGFILAASGIATSGVVAQTGILDTLINEVLDLIGK